MACSLRRGLKLALSHSSAALSSTRYFLLDVLVEIKPVTAESSRAFLKNTFVERWGDPLMGWSCWTSTGDPYANVGDAGLMLVMQDSVLMVKKLQSVC